MDFVYKINKKKKKMSTKFLGPLLLTPLRKKNPKAGTEFS